MNKSSKAAEAAQQLVEGGLDQVRDILFGEQSRKFERRFADLEKELKKSFDELERRIEKEVKSLIERLGKEEADRQAAVKAGAADLDQAAKTIHESLVRLEDSLNRAEHALKEQLDDQSKNLTHEMRQLHEEAQQSLASASDRLRHDKTDRAALASLLREVAERLAAEPEGTKPTEAERKGQNKKSR